MVIRRLSRRAFVNSLAAMAASSAVTFEPHSVHAQQPGLSRRIGVLSVVWSSESKAAQAFRQGLSEAGYEEGRDVIIVWRSANGNFARVPEMVADLVHSKVDVIVVQSTPAMQAVVKATSNIPIVMALVADPAGSGLVANLAHPGGNVTGLSLMTAELGAKRLQLLKEAIPYLTRVAVLWNPDTPWHPKAIADLKAAAPALSLKLSFVSARSPDKFGFAISEIRRSRAQALYVVDDSMFSAYRKTLVKLASTARLPTSNPIREFVDEGGLMSYAPNVPDMFRRSAGYVDKILKGANPGDLPIEQPTKFEFVVNLKTARALGLEIPDSVLLEAEVIR